MDKKFKVSVIFPSYNESENIEEAIGRVANALGNNLHEVIVVDDDSPDGTWKIIQNMKNFRYKVIRRTNERGLASAIARGIKESTGNVVAWLDCDLGVPPEVVPKMVEKLKDYDLAIASRYVEGGKDLRPKFRAFGSHVMVLFANMVLGSEVKDYASGVIAVKKEVANNINFSTRGFGEYFIEFVYKSIKKGYKATEVGYIYKQRKKGKSKSDDNILLLIKYAIQYAAKIIKIRFSRS